MSQTDELLDNLSEEEIRAYSNNPETEPHIVIGSDRFITVPEELKKIGVQYDHNIETVTFDCVRYWDGHDLYDMTIYINYMRADGEMGSYLVDDSSLDENDDGIIHFTWTISGHVTYVRGNISFLICAKKTDENGMEILHWNSELNEDLYVSKGMECSTSVVEVESDIITQLLMRMDTAEKAVLTADVTGALKQYEETQKMIEDSKTSLETFINDAETAKRELIESAENDRQELIDKVLLDLSTVAKPFNVTQQIPDQGGTITIHGLVITRGVQGMIQVDKCTFENLYIPHKTDNWNATLNCNLFTMDETQKPLGKTVFTRDYFDSTSDVTAIISFICDSDGVFKLEVKTRDPKKDLGIPNVDLGQFNFIYLPAVSYGTPVLSTTGTMMVNGTTLVIKNGKSSENDEGSSDLSNVTFTLITAEGRTRFTTDIAVASQYTWKMAIDTYGERGDWTLDGGVIIRRYSDGNGGFLMGYEYPDPDGTLGIKVMYLTYPDGSAVNTTDLIQNVDYGQTLTFD